MKRFSLLCRRLVAATSLSARIGTLERTMLGTTTGPDKLRGLLPADAAVIARISRLVCDYASRR